MLDYVQVWSPDTCGCIVHQAGDQDAADTSRVMRYVTYEEAVEIHVRHFWARPESTNYKVWWSMPRKSKSGRLKSPKRIIALVQPHPRLCPAHLALGYTGEMYETVRELNTRKNIACYLAWVIGNDISEEDQLWVRLGSTKPILIAGRVTTEQAERQASLSRVFPPGAVQWVVEQPSGAVWLEYLRDWLPQEQADAIQGRCDREFGPGRVVVV